MYSIQYIIIKIEKNDVYNNEHVIDIYVCPIYKK